MPRHYLSAADLSRPQAQLLGQGADAGADFQHTGGFVHPGILGDGGGHPGGNQKILPLGLGKVKAMLRQKRLHDLNIANINHRVSFSFYKIGSGGQSPVGAATSRPKRIERELSV